MNLGYIKLHRKLLDNPYSHKPNFMALWVTLLLLANHKENKFMWNGKVLIIKEGQFITGRKELSKQTGIPATTIERILETLENGHQIGQQKTTKYRLITIVNWTEHQNLDSKVDNKRTTNGQQTDTNNIGKNEKNERNTISGCDDEFFTLFWEKYPPRRKQDKQKCLKKFQSYSKEIQETIVSDVIKRKALHEDWIKEDGRYVPAPIVYLNNQRWEAPIVETKRMEIKSYGK
jgi:hypothetical protein